MTTVSPLILESREGYSSTLVSALPPGGTVGGVSRREYLVPVSNLSRWTFW